MSKGNISYADIRRYEAGRQEDWLKETVTPQKFNKETQKCGGYQFPSDTSTKQMSNTEAFWHDVDEVIPMDIQTAASLGDCHGISAALARSETVNQFSSVSCWTPLMFAASRNHEHVAMQLIKLGANVCVRSRPKGRTALALAASGGSLELVFILAREIIQQKSAGALLLAEIVCDSKRKNVRRHLPWLQQEFDPAVAELSNLFQEQKLGVDMWDYSGWSPLMYAVVFGTADVIQCLLNLGSNVNHVDVHGKTPLMMAAECVRQDVVHILLDAGADPNAKSEVGLTAIDYAALNDCDNIASMIQSAIEYKSQMGNKGLCPVILILASLDLCKYIPVFISNNIHSDKFNLLTDDDLQELGVTALGPRKKILLAIKKHLTKHSVSGLPVPQVFSSLVTKLNET